MTKLPDGILNIIFLYLHRNGDETIEYKKYFRFFINVVFHMTTEKK